VLRTIYVAFRSVRVLLNGASPIAGVRPLVTDRFVPFVVPRVGLLEIAALRRVVNSIQG
jgi:hypothetical protein